MHVNADIHSSFIHHILNRFPIKADVYFDWNWSWLLEVQSNARRWVPKNAWEKMFWSIELVIYQLHIHFVKLQIACSDICKRRNAKIFKTKVVNFYIRVFVFCLSDGKINVGVVCVLTIHLFLCWNNQAEPCELIMRLLQLIFCFRTWKLEQISSAGYDVMSEWGDILGGFEGKC